MRIAPSFADAGLKLASTGDLEIKMMQFAVARPRYQSSQNIVAKNFVSKIASAFSVNNFAPVLA
jgi:hypothetical protein